jgi:hypothetical protein
MVTSTKTCINQCWQILQFELSNSRALVQVLVIEISPNTILMELAQVLDDKTHLLLEPKTKLKPQK